MSTTVGFFTHFDEAQKAVRALEDAGIESGRIGIIPEDSDPTDKSDAEMRLKKKKSDRFIVSVETRSAEEEQIIQEILGNAGAVHLGSRGSGTDDPARQSIQGTDL